MKRSVLAPRLAVYIAAIALLFAVASGLGMSQSEKSDFAMDTFVSVKIIGKDSDGTADAVLAAIKSLEGDCLSRTNKESDISELNLLRSISGANPATLNALGTALDVCKKSAGAFDITLGAVSDLWDFKSGAAALPDEGLLAAAMSDVGYGSISVSGSSVSIEGNPQIDLGSVGKGAACDSARELLAQTQTKEAVVSVGGSVLLFGQRDFEVGVRDPFGGASDFAGVLTVSSACVSTSGIYERGFDLNGTRYHHILSSQTGYPVQNGLVSVTVVSESGVLSDALSTACFALGVEGGMALAEEYSAGAVFITEDKTVYVSDNLAGSLELLGGYAAAE